MSGPGEQTYITGVAGGGPVSPHNDVLEQAKATINGDRRDAYGDVRVSFEKIAAGWTAILGIPVSAMDVDLCMLWLKICREKNKHQIDNIIDLVGYSALAADLISHG